MLASSCDLYDRGHLYEAQRIANCVHTIAFDGGRNFISLLTQLGVRSGQKELLYTSTGRGIEINWLPQHPLVGLVEISGRITYKPLLDGSGQFMAGRSAPQRIVSFRDWWRRETVILIPNSKPLMKITRMRLTQAMRHQDGGAHVDPELNYEDYVHFLKNPIWRQKFEHESADRSVLGVCDATMRQIGWEIQTTLDRAGIV